MNTQPLAYLITMTTYGTWLVGDARGSWSRDLGRGVRVAPSSEREQHARRKMRCPAFDFDAAAREQVDTTIREVCEHRGWLLHAVNVRLSHVHVVVGAEVHPDRVANGLKAWVTRRLREAGLVGADQRVWTDHQSTRWLWTEDDVGAAGVYVVERQGEPLTASAWAAMEPERHPLTGGGLETPRSVVDPTR